MCELYGYLGKGWGKQYLLEETIALFQNVHPYKIKKSIGLLYMDAPIRNPLEVALLLVRGLKRNDFFEFQEFMEHVNGSSKH